MSGRPPHAAAFGAFEAFYEVDDEAGRGREVAPEDVAERLQFLDPEIKATHSRIDILESICQSNTNRIEAVQKSQNKFGRGEQDFKA